MPGAQLLFYISHTPNSGHKYSSFVLVLVFAFNGNCSCIPEALTFLFGLFGSIWLHADRLLSI